MTLLALDTAYTKMKSYCLQIMQEEGMPYCAMDFVISKLYADIQSFHLSEITEMNTNVQTLDMTGDEQDDVPEDETLIENE